MQIRKATLKDIPELIKIRKKQLIDEGKSAIEDIDSELYHFFYDKMSDDSMIELITESDDEIVATTAIIFMISHRHSLIKQARVVI